MIELKPDVMEYLTAFELGMDQDAIKQSFANHVEYTQGRDGYSLTLLDCVQALIHTTRDRLSDRWNRTQRAYYQEDSKRVYYLSMEFLVGRLLESAMINVGMLDQARKAMEELGLDLNQIAGNEWEPGLGNGGLGRLAACFLDSMATLGIPAMGYGIRYEYGIFRQAIVNGQQVEHPDNWLRYGNSWEMPRPSRLFPVNFYGRVIQYKDRDGDLVTQWVDTEQVMALGYDFLVPGYRNDKVNTLRLWSAKASREFDLSYFNHGDYIQAVHDKDITENITRVLYPDDSSQAGRELRLKQEYFFVCASLQDAMGRHLKTHGTLQNLSKRAVFQLNDTHPAIAVPEMMRLLMDLHNWSWDASWAATTQCFAYTNHTVLPEALEKWPVTVLEHVLPRHLQIIYEINRRLLEEVAQRYPGDAERLRRMSLIEETPVKQVRMANLAIVGSFSVNGVSQLHSRLIREQLFADFAEFYPGRFNNKTNGITPRRWLLQCNPELAGLITSAIGEGWCTDLHQLKGLEAHAADRNFQRRWMEVKGAKKGQLALWIRQHEGTTVDPHSLFDVQVKRIHEYKRQLMNILHVLSLYIRLRSGQISLPQPRTFIFAGKAAPAYDMAKRILRLIVEASRVINTDPEVNGLLKVVFLPNYNVTLAERVMPAADVSEQISTAGTEASGTSNMKFALNGALTVGTLDGANVEIREAVGAENLFIFGLTAEQVAARRAQGYEPRRIYESSPVLRQVLDSLVNNRLLPGGHEWCQPILQSLLDRGDPYLVLADFEAYCACQESIGLAFQDQAAWARKSILTVANMGRFSSDETIAQYAKDIWHVPLHGQAPPG